MIPFLDNTVHSKTLLPCIIPINSSILIAEKKLNMYFSKNSLVDIYRIRVKKINRPNISMIMVWMEEISDKRQECSSSKDQQLTLTWVSFTEEMQKKLSLLDGDTEKLIKYMVNIFQEEYCDTINKLTQVATLEKVHYMTGLIESFITVCVEQMGTDQLNLVASCDKD